MGPPPPPTPQGLFCLPAAATWPWGAEQSSPGPRPWRADGMEGLHQGAEGGAGAGLRFLLRFDPGRPGLDRTLLGFSLSAVFGRLLGWGGSGGRGASVAIAAGEEGGGDSGGAAVSAAALAAAVSLSLAAMYAADHRPPGARRRRLAAPSSARQRALPAPGDGLRILSSKDESSESVIHGASVGAGDDDDDEPAIIARVETTQTGNMPRANAAATAAADGTEDGRPEPEEERQELARLRELWLSLLEREQRLELRLQELERLREQGAAVRELEGRAAAAAAEERLLQLRVAALQEENGRLRAQAEELGAASAELARAREKLRATKARVRAEQEEARREAAALRARVAELERGGEERAAALEAEAEAEALRKANAALEEENLELALRLQDAQQAASSSVNFVLEEDVVEEARYLRETNERLTREIEQLRNDHCAHVEELVYLKWVNACLRHELRGNDGHPPSSSPYHQDHHDADDNGGARGMSAMDLSKSMSFRSSERAKQLMLRYGHPGLDGGFDPALFSPLHESVDGDGEGRMRARNYEAERSPGPMLVAPAMAAAGAATGSKKAGPRKLKFLGNIKKLLPGGKRSHRETSRKAPAPSDEYLEKAMRWLSTHDVLDGDHSYESTPLSSCDRTPLSSVTTATTRDSRVARGGGGGVGVRSERGETPAEAGPATLARSKSDAGASYGREAGRYHALRPDRPAGAGVEPDGFRAPEKRELRRRSEEVSTE